MTMPSPAALAAAYLQALCADLRAVAVATADGRLLAGDAGTAARAAAASRGATAGAGEVLHVARDDRHVIAVVTGPRALGGVVGLDLAAGLRILATGYREQT